MLQLQTPGIVACILQRIHDRATGFAIRQIGSDWLLPTPSIGQATTSSNHTTPRSRRFGNRVQMAKCGAAGAHHRHPSHLLHNGPTQLTGCRVRQAACRTLVRRKAENSVDGKRYFGSATVRLAKFPIRAVNKHQSAEKLPIEIVKKVSNTG
jgi:hypothetical protein